MSSNELPDRLCHYTNAAGKLEFYEEQLWATVVGYLNDSQNPLRYTDRGRAGRDQRRCELKLENIRPPRNLRN